MWSTCRLAILFLGAASFLSGQLEQSFRTSPGQVCGLKDVIAVAAGGIGGLAVKSDGTVWQLYGPSGPEQIPELRDAVSVAGGLVHNIALKSDGTVWEWPGLVVPTENRTPSQIIGVTDVVAIAAGETRSVAVKRDGTVWEWTRNSEAGAWLKEEAPNQVGGLDGVVAVSVAYEAWWDVLCDSRTLALKNDGTVWAWNKGEYAREGLRQIEQLTGVVAITAGPAGDVALKEDGTVWQWDDRLIPAQVGGLDRIVAVANGSHGSGFLGPSQIFFGLALDSEGKVWEWGSGLNSSATWPVPVEGIADVAKITAAGVYSSGIMPVAAAIKRDGTLWWWETWNARLSDGGGCDESQAVPAPR